MRSHLGDVTQASSLRGALGGVEAIIHLVGIISQVGPSTFENVHVRGTQNVLAAAQEAGVRRFVQMSALGTRPNASSVYHLTKWAAEEAVRHGGLDYTIFRPSLIFGPRDQFVNLFAGISRFSPILPILGDGAARFQPVAVQAVAAAFTKSLTDGAALGQTFDLCGPDTLTFEEMLDEILAATGRRRVKVHLPLGVARVQTALLEWLFSKLLHRAPPLNRDQLIMLQEDNIGRGEQANALLRSRRLDFTRESPDT